MIFLEQVYKDLVVVVASKSEEARILPCFLRAPPGTKEYHEMIAEQQETIKCIKIKINNFFKAYIVYLISKAGKNIINSF